MFGGSARAQRLNLRLQIVDPAHGSLLLFFGLDLWPGLGQRLLVFSLMMNSPFLLIIGGFVWSS